MNKTDRTAAYLAGLCGFMGVAHFAKPEPFDDLIPERLPGTARQWTYGSGVAELATAALLAIPRTRKIGGAAAIALFIGVFPGNLKMAWDWRFLPASKQAITLGRLPFQALLIKQADNVRRSA